MKVFPVDSIVTKLGDDGLPVYDRPYVSADLREVYANFFSNGVFMDDGTALHVTTATGGMNVVVKPGTCHMNGAFGFETVDRTLQLNAADPNLDRIDTVVARLDLGIDARSIDLYVLKGTPAADPVRRNLTRNETVWELGLADIYLPKGITTISQARISDTRMETERCGAVTPFVEFDTTALYDQLKQATDDAVQAMNDALDGTTAGNLKRYRRSLRVEEEIPSGADLNTYQSAGNYGCSVASNVASVTNKPSGLTSTFLLFVHAIGDRAMQEIVDSENGSRWCRAGTSDWVQTYDSVVSQVNILAGPKLEKYMSDGQIVMLSDLVSKQLSGIVLCWAAYVDGETKNYDNCYTFIPKSHVAMRNGQGVVATMSTAGFGHIGAKYVYVYDDRIEGNDLSSGHGTRNGVTFDNRYWVLDSVVGV